MLQKLTQPKVLVPILLSLALLAVVFGLSDLPSVIDRIWHIPIWVMATSLGLAVVYLVLKGIQFHFLLGSLGIEVTWRQVVVAFAVGEMVLPIPAGIYAQNYILRRIKGADFSTSAAATTAMLAIEATISLMTLAALGIPGWDWLGPVIFAFFVIAAVIVLPISMIGWLRRRVAQLVQLGPLKRVGPEFIELAEGMRSFFTPPVLVRVVPLAVVYLAPLLTAFLLVAHAVGVTKLTFEQAVTIYLFSLALVLVSPFSTHLGVVEAGGTTAAQAWGYTWSQGLAMLLGFRLVWTGAVWIVCGLVLLVLRNELSRSPNQRQESSH